MRTNIEERRLQRDMGPGYFVAGPFLRVVALKLVEGALALDRCDGQTPLSNHILLVLPPYTLTRLTLTSEVGTVQMRAAFYAAEQLPQPLVHPLLIDLASFADDGIDPTDLTKLPALLKGPTLAASYAPQVSAVARRIKNVIDRHGLSAEPLSRLLRGEGFRVEYGSRYLLEAYGVSAQTYRNALRSMIARQLMTDGLTVMETAENVGFSSREGLQHLLHRLKLPAQKRT